MKWWSGEMAILKIGVCMHFTLSTQAPLVLWFCLKISSSRTFTRKTWIFISFQTLFTFHTILLNYKKNSLRMFTNLVYKKLDEGTDYSIESSQVLTGSNLQLHGMLVRVVAFQAKEPRVRGPRCNKFLLYEGWLTKIFAFRYIYKNTFSALFFWSVLKQGN